MQIVGFPTMRLISLFYVVCHLNKMLLITGFTLIIVIHVLVNLTNVFHTNSLPSLLSYLLNLLYIYNVFCYCYFNLSISNEIIQ